MDGGRGRTLRGKKSVQSDSGHFYIIISFGNGNGGGDDNNNIIQPNKQQQYSNNNLGNRSVPSECAVYLYLYNISSTCIHYGYKSIYVYNIRLPSILYDYKPQSCAGVGGEWADGAYNVYIISYIYMRIYTVCAIRATCIY